MRAAEWLRAARERLEAAGIESAATEAQALLAAGLGWSRSRLLAYPEAEVPASVDGLLARRIGREPLAYILGEREFWGRRFRVGPAVLVPRHETETLITLALGQPWETGLDIGTGSGCLAVTLALERGDSRWWAVDLSPEALEVARGNAGKLGAEVEFGLADGFPAASGAERSLPFLHAEGFGPREGWDLVISNPPYIDPDAVLPPEVGRHEPAMALFAEEGGLAAYRSLAGTAWKLLSPGGCLIVEIGDGMAELVDAVFAEAGWRLGDARSDLDGRPRARLYRPE